MRDAKAPGKVNRPCFSINGGKVSDGFGVILGRFHCMFVPGASEGGGLHFGRPCRPALSCGAGAFG